MNFEIKPMQKKDVQSVFELEKETFGNSHWSKESFYNELSNNLANYYCMYNNNTLIGFAGFWHIIDEAHITTISIKKEYRQQKLGERLLNYIIQECYKKEIKYITLEVRVSNLPAINMYEKYGFKSLGSRKNYYQDNNEDALIMWTENIFWDKFKNNYTEKTNKLKELL